MLIKRGDPMPVKADSPEWRQTADLLTGEGGTAIILGAPDTGKTALARCLMRDISSSGRRVGWIDTDVGQTTLGPPCTIGMKLFDSPAAMEDLDRSVHLHFVGSTSPVGHLLEMVVGTRRLVERALSMGAQNVIVDTTGLVRGPVGTALKTKKMELVRPDHLIALQREDEIETLLRPFSLLSKPKVIRLKAGTEASVKTEGRRRDHREARYERYFAGAALRKVALKDAAVWGHWMGTGRQVEPKGREYLAAGLNTRVIHAERGNDVLHIMIASEYHAGGTEEIGRRFGVSRVNAASVSGLKNRLVALQDGEMEVLGLGVIRFFNGDDLSLSIYTPLRDMERVRGIVFGSMKLEISSGGIKESLFRRYESC